MVDTLDLFDTVGVARVGLARVSVAPVDVEGEVIARVLAADAAAFERAATSGVDGPRSAAWVLRELASVGEALTRMAQARSLRAVAGLVEELRGEDTARAGDVGRVGGRVPQCPGRARAGPRD